MSPRTDDESAASDIATALIVIAIGLAALSVSLVVDGAVRWLLLGSAIVVILGGTTMTGIAMAKDRAPQRMSSPLDGSWLPSRDGDE